MQILELSLVYARNITLSKLLPAMPASLRSLIVERLDQKTSWHFPSDGYDPSIIYSFENEKLITDPDVRWNDIAGLNDAKKPSFYLFPCPTFTEAFIDR